MPLPLYLGAVLALLPLSLGAEPPPDDISAPKENPAAEAAESEKTESPSDRLKRTISKDHDPTAAEAFLKDRALQDQIRKDDPALFEKLFSAAAEARDLQDLLTLQKDDMAGLREALATRGEMPLAQDVDALLAWAKKNVKGIDPAALDKALWGWSHLTDEQKTHLAGKGLSAAGWKKMSFPERHKAMAAWREGIHDQIMAMNPKSDADINAMKALQRKGAEAFSYDQSVAIERRIKQARAAVGGLSQAEQLLASVNNSKLRGELAQARSAASPSDALRSLGTIFDGLGVRNAEVDAERPVTAAQTLKESDRQVVAQMLATGFRRELAGTTGGDRLLAFYADPKKRPMNIAIEDAGSAMAYYQNNRVVFGQRTVDRYLKTYAVKATEDTMDANGKLVKKGETLRVGITVDEIKKNTEAMQGLVWELAPCFVHEGTHHMQDVWARENNIPRWYVQRKETETMSLQALFVLEKSRANPDYAAFLQERKPVSERVQTDLRRSRSLETDPVEFRDGIRTLYGEIDTAESAAWTSIDSGSPAGIAQRGYYAFNDRADAVDLLVQQRLQALRTSASAPTTPPSRVSGTLAVPVPKPAVIPKRPATPPLSERSDE